GSVSGQSIIRPCMERLPCRCSDEGTAAANPLSTVIPGGTCPPRLRGGAKAMTAYFEDLATRLPGGFGFAGATQTPSRATVII
ncbi:MAG: hypothetical protein JWP73_1791, partial [Phenylobacterium sp.]|nr:hypothetical protein [Phenylobacterium sp.]